MDNALNLLVHLGHDCLALVLLQFQILRHHGQDTLHIGQLTATGRDLEINVLHLQHGRVALDDLPARVLGGLCFECDLSSALLNLACGLDLGVLQVAVRALKGHDDDFAEVGDLGEQQPCRALIRSAHVMVCMILKTHILVAVHAQALNLVDDLAAGLVVGLRLGLCDLAAHIREQILCQTLVRHFEK